MYAGEDTDDGRTAFRRAEKRYKLHREQTFRRRRGRLKSAGFSTRAVDLSDVLDLARFRAREATDPAVRRVDVDVGDATRPDVVETYRLETHPGLVLVPGALTVPEQRRWLKAAVTTLCEPPARTNHAAAHGAFADLWTQACRPDARALEPPPNDPADRPHPGALRGWVTLDPPPRAGDPRRVVLASSLLRRLRWATLGAPYDWTTRVYEHDAPHNLPPEPLRAACRRLAAAAGVTDFAADAGLVNYYRSGDALAGHVDDAEANLDRPIVSLSLGCPAVFLLGGATRDEEPVAVLLRSGDAAVLTGATRRWFHGVPRIFAGDEGVVDARGDPLRAPRELSDAEVWTEEPKLAEYVAGGRVNVSLRDGVR